MLKYDDDFSLYAEDDTQDVTCRMCETDCTLYAMCDGLCPACFSLCASAPVPRADAYTRRSHLVSLTRKAFNAWGEASELYQNRVTALRPSQSCIDEAADLTAHRYRRYNLLESKLADETRMTKFAVYNQISAFPSCSRLLSANL